MSSVITQRIVCASELLSLGEKSKESYVFLEDIPGNPNHSFLCDNIFLGISLNKAK